MHRLEEQVRPIVSGMLRGRGRALHHDGQTTITTWATLKAFMAQRTVTRDDPLHEVPRAHYDELYALQTSPHPDSRVYTARVAFTEGRAQPGFYHRNSVALTPPGEPPPRDRADGYMLTFSVLDLMPQVFRGYGDGHDYIHRSQLAPCVRQIWPPLGSFTWPPGPPLTSAGLRAIAGPAPEPSS
jgi:hypothetical protein